MAPPTTRQSTRSVTKRQPPARKQRPTRQTSQQSPEWDIIAREDDDEDLQTPDFIPDDFEQNNALMTRESSGIEAALNPLREMADRVGREVETFAEKLDQFLSSLPERNTFEAVLGLVEQFRDLAKEAADSLQKNHERDVALQLRKEWHEREKLAMRTSALVSSTADESGPFLSKKKAEQVKELRQWQQEADIWDLFRIMLELHHNPDPLAVQQAKEESLQRLGHVHRYTSEDELFSRFILEDDLAAERLMVKKWLEQTVEHQQSGLPDIVQELESKTPRGKGMWKNGWLYSREKIKGEKRTRSWSNAPGMPLPHVRRTDNTQLLVTTLDPDAKSRQERTLEKEDEYFERAMWIVCWELLRRGVSWEGISQWCEQQREGWRAVSIGVATEPADSLSRATFRHICHLASQADGSSDHEAAVYGLLGGSYAAVQRVCRNVDDRLYGYYSTALVRQFDQYLTTHFPAWAPQARRGLGDDAATDPQEQIVDLIERLRREPDTSTESVQPMKMIQSYLLANDVGSMIHTMGYAVSVTDTMNGQPENLILRLKPFWPGDDNQPEANIAIDRQALRIATHMSIILAELRGDERDRKLEDEEQAAEDNVTTAYIQALREVRNREIIPLYASRLGYARRIIVMSQTLGDITSPSEQEGMLTLLTQYGMDTILILNEMLFHQLSQHVGSRLQNAAPLKMLEETDDPLYPGQRILQDFLPTGISEQDELIVGSLQWFNIISGYWKETFHNMGLALRKCLVAGRIACALRIVAQCPFDALSIRKAYSEIGRSVNIMTYDGEIDIDEKGQWEEMKAQAQTYYDLVQIVDAIKALAHYRDTESQYTGKAMKLSSAPQALKEAKEIVDEAMEFILVSDTDVLQHARGSDEEKDLEYIRTHFIPELIIAYNTVLHSAGAVISRENLIQSMDLSVTVANKDKINECFTKAGRMRELVKSFAETSKKMLILKAEGKPWKPRKDHEGKDLGIWEIGPQHGHGNNHEISL